MNILFICNEYPPGKNGGIGSITRSLAREMVNRGHTVLVAGLYEPGYGQSDYEEDEGVKVWRKRLRLDKLVKNNYSFLNSAILKALTISGIRQSDTLDSLKKFNDFIQTLINDFNIDIIEWPDFNAYFRYLPVNFSWPALSVPLIVKFHGTETYIMRQMQEAIDEKIYYHEKQHINRADALLSVSRNTAENYSKFYHLSQPATVLYNSIEVPPVKYLGNANTIVFTGAFTRLKGIENLLKAWQIVHKEKPSAELHLFGKGKLKKFLQHLTPCAQSTIHNKGFVSKEVLYEALSGAAAAIFPSYTECFAIAPLEAMAVGCPVIYTNRVSGPELIQPHVNGLLVDPENPEEIASSILLMLENSQLREKFSVNGRKTIEQRFQIKQSVGDHLEFYTKVIQTFWKKLSGQW
jgi:glycosyltransferase involved in cell wall biosynthesis